MPSEVKAVDKPSVFMENGKAVYRASALGNCQNALLLARLGYSGSLPPEKMQARYDEGHAQESIIGAKLEKDFGFHLYGEQSTMEVDCGSSALVRGHVDWLVGDSFEATWVAADQGFSHAIRRTSAGAMYHVDPPGPVVVDAKALAVSSFDSWMKYRWDAFPYYLWQQSVYAHAIGAAGVVMAIKNKNTSEYLVEYFPIEELMPMSDIIRRVLHIEAMVANGVMPFTEPCTPKMYPCPYFMFHSADEKKEAPAELQKLIDERQRVKAEMGALDGRVIAIDQKILQLCKEPGTYGTEGFTTTLYRSGSSKTDWDLIAACLGTGTAREAKEQFVTKTQADKLSVRVTAIPQKETS
jgi:hypothetical protein